MSSMSAIERMMDAAWKRGLARRRWDGMAREVGDALASAWDSGSRLYLPEGAGGGDIARFLEASRRLTMRAMQEVEPRYAAASARHGEDMVAAIYLLFFDEDDANMRQIPRGVPAAISRRAARFDIPIAQARTGLEILGQDADMQALVRTIPRRSVLPALDEARRSYNVGIAEAGISAPDAEIRPDAPAPRRRFPLWEIREIMDRRTRGNPAGDFPSDGYHWQVSGYINTMEEIVRQDCVPPCGHNCRASLFPVSRERAETLGLVDSAGQVDFAAIRAYNGDRQGYIDRGQYPDPRFR